MSTGHGIETEAMFHAFSKFTANESAFFTDSLDNYCVLRTISPAAAARAVSDQRRTDMLKLGALTALMLLGGWKPGQLDPLFVHYVLYACDFHCLTPDTSWHLRGRLGRQLGGQAICESANPWVPGSPRFGRSSSFFDCIPDPQLIIAVLLFGHERGQLPILTWMR